MKNQTAVIIAIAVFVCILFTVSTIHNYEEAIQKFHRNIATQPVILKKFDSIMQWEIPQYWKDDLEKMKEIDQTTAFNVQKQKDNNKNSKADEIISGKMTRAELGRHGWSILHMNAATYPTDVDTEFVGQFYPCKECAQNFLDRIHQKPFNGTGRKDYMVYMCEIHNMANIDLGKKVIDCQTENFKIWGGSCGCSD